MKNIIDHVDNSTLSKFTKDVKKILESKMHSALEVEKLEAVNKFIKEDSDYDENCEEYDEEDPNFDVDIDPENFDENDLVDLESSIWDDEEFEEAFENEDGDLLDEELELSYEQLVYCLENFEQLDELSKKTLGSYLKKAVKSSNAAVNTHANDKLTAKDWQTARKTMDKRNKFIPKAIDKLTKEQIEHLEELSKNTLMRYKVKASIDGNNQADKMFANKDKTKKAREATSRKWLNREKGIDKATKKLND